MDLQSLVDQVTGPNLSDTDGLVGIEERLDALRSVRDRSAEAARELDRFLMNEISRLREGLIEASEQQEKLRVVIDRLTAQPWYPAIVLGLAMTDHGEAALVAQGESWRVVGLADGITSNDLAVGDEVLLAHEQNVVLERSPYSSFRAGETGVLQRITADGRLVLQSRDEEIVLNAAASLPADVVRVGDQIRWDRRIGLALERMERDAGAGLFLEDTPAEGFDAIGGLDGQIEALQRSIRLHLQHTDLVRRYRLRRKGSVLLVGPPGTGKTMMARALAHWLGSESRSGRSRFMNIKPAGLHSMWYAQSEANYREAFRVAREAGECDPDVPIVMFFDEVDAIGGARGESLMRVDDRVLTAFMAELDGLEARGNILVVAATNRRDAIDPALLRPGRLGDLVLEIPRPMLQAARAIFGKHLPPDIPYAGESRGQDGSEARLEIIEAALSALYAPNGDPGLATITFRDGKRRTVYARDLISGAQIAKIATLAIERACVRELEIGGAGVQTRDLLSAIEEELNSAAGVLTPANCHKHLLDLPQDVDVVQVQPVRARARGFHRYVRVA